jgi:signal transduction histidine kinase
MTDTTRKAQNTAHEQFVALAAYLEERREAILVAWGEAVDGDPELEGAPALSIEHFRDCIQVLLNDFGRDLRALFGVDPAAREEEEKESVDHGLHRWQQGYSLRELIREWGHLQLAMLDELESYGAAHPELESRVLIAARRRWVELCSVGINESVEQYSRVREAEAAGRLNDLEQALDYLRSIERQRAEAWREAAHDLRGNVSLVTTTTSILNEDGVPEPMRSRALQILQSSVSLLHKMLEDLMSLARLEAGHEERKVAPFDAAVQLREMCHTLEPLAHERGLFLKTAGPTALPVEGDAVKVLRIAQNLTLNALKYTQRGGVTVTWEAGQETHEDGWTFSVRDSGPGLTAQPGAPIVHKLEEATAVARSVEGREPPPSAPPAPYQRPGEGIGLSIVKRLCELLEASLEVETRPGEGTTFLVKLPRRYPSPPRPHPSGASGT